jgi:hypothetical protein
MGYIGDKRQAEIRPAIIAELAKTVSQHRQNVKRMVMMEWVGKFLRDMIVPLFKVLTLILFLLCFFQKGVRMLLGYSSRVSK